MTIVRIAVHNLTNNTYVDFNTEDELLKYVQIHYEKYGNLDLEVKSYRI